MMDCFAEEIIAVAMDDNMKKELCIRALKEAYELRKPADGLIITVMQVLNTSVEPTGLTELAIMQFKAWRCGKCYDNARIESLF